MAKRSGCPDLDPSWPNVIGEPRGPTLCVLYPNCKCGKEDSAPAVHGYTCRKCGVWYAGPNGFHDCPVTASGANNA